MNEPDDKLTRLRNLLAQPSDVINTPALIKFRGDDFPPKPPLDGLSLEKVVETTLERCGLKGFLCDFPKNASKGYVLIKKLAETNAERAPNYARLNQYAKLIEHDPTALTQEALQECAAYFSSEIRRFEARIQLGGFERIKSTKKGLRVDTSKPVAEVDEEIKAIWKIRRDLFIETLGTLKSIAEILGHDLGITETLPTERGGRGA
jgi:hypothetical protein